METKDTLKRVAKEHGWIIKEELDESLTFARPGNKDFTVTFTRYGGVKSYYGLDKAIKTGKRSTNTMIAFEQLSQEQS